MHYWTAGDPQALPEHAPEWVNAICAGGGHGDATRLYEFDDGRRFVLPLVFPRAPSAWAAAWGPGGSGAYLSADLDEHVIRTVLEDLRSLGAARLVVRPGPLRVDAWAPAHCTGVTVLPRRAHVADLSDGPAAVRARLPSLTFRNLRITERRRVRVDVDTAGRLHPVYYRFHLTSVERRAENQHGSRVLARWRAPRRDPLEKFEAKSKHLSEASRLFVAFVGDRPAASVVVLFGRTARYIRGAMDRANDALHLAAIDQVCLDGCSTDHLGKSRASASLARCEERFGAVPVDYSEYRIERLPITAVDSAVRSAVKTVLRFRDA